jgi:hypothetical protein
MPELLVVLGIAAAIVHEAARIFKRFDMAKGSGEKVSKTNAEKLKS